jgi:hypothetical protein
VDGGPDDGGDPGTEVAERIEGLHVELLLGEGPAEQCTPDADDRRQQQPGLASGQMSGMAPEMAASTIQAMTPMRISLLIGPHPNGEQPHL